MKQTKIDAIKANYIHCFLSIISCALVVIFVFAGLIIRFFFTKKLDVEGTEGAAGFRMFTILSNLIVALCAGQSIPYAIDGFRNGNYHLPRWIVYVLYAGVTNVFITFLICLCVLAPIKGFDSIFLSSSNLFLHLLSPLSSTIMFIFFNTSHTIKFNKTWVGLLMPYGYITLYALMVFVFKLWNDYYSIGTILPWPISCLLFLPVAFLLTTILRISHNHFHKEDKENMQNYYLHDKEYEFASVEEAIAHLADIKAKNDLGGELIVPRRLISLLIKRYDAKGELKEYINVYINHYYKNK